MNLITYIETILVPNDINKTAGFQIFKSEEVCQRNNIIMVLCKNQFLFSFTTLLEKIKLVADCNPALIMSLMKQFFNYLEFSDGLKFITKFCH